MLLARMLTPLDWDGAVRYLDYPESFINKGYTTTSVKLRTIGRFDELVHRIQQIANQHAEHELIDYKQRRALLADWAAINRDTWLLLRPRRGQSRWRGDTPSRRTRASVWLWCELTSGHERAAPIAQPTTNLAHQTELQQAIEHHQTPAPSAPTTPHQKRMRHVAQQIQARAIELLAASHGIHIARRAGVVVCRQHTDLTCPTIAAIHNVTDAQPAFSRATVARYRREDPEFDQRYQQLLDYGEHARRTAGFANANLALTTKPPGVVQGPQLEQDPAGELAARVPSGAAATISA